MEFVAVVLGGKIRGAGTATWACTNGASVASLELVARFLPEQAKPALACNVAHGNGQRDMRQH